MSGELSAELQHILPCRTGEITKLHNLFGEPPFVDFIYVYGGPSTGKTAVITAFLSRMAIRHAIINLTECYTNRILYQTIISKLCSVSNAKCDSMCDFVSVLNERRSLLTNAVIVVDEAEKLRSMDSNMLMGFAKLRELTNVPITVVFVSQIIVQKLYPKSFVQPLKIHFAQYTKDELLEILALDHAEARCGLARSGIVAADFCDIAFYKAYLDVFLSTFYRACRDLRELRRCARSNFAKYCQPVVGGELRPADAIGLWRRFAPTLKAALDSLYLRCADGEAAVGRVRDIELPFYAKYLLVAAFLASHNPSKDDKRLFVKHHGKQRKTAKDVAKKSKVSEALTTQMGPKPFTLDRLLAIFYAILEDEVGFNSHLLTQVASLVELQLLTAMSDNQHLDAPRFKCNVNFDFIQTVSKTIDFNIRKYLSDFCHM